MATLTYPYTKSLRAYPVSFCGLGGEQGKIIPIDISWDVANNYQNEEIYEISLLATEKGSQLPRVVSVYIDNGFFNGTTSVKCMDTGQVVTLIGYHKGWFTLLTNGFQFQIIRDAMQFQNTPKNTCQYIFTNAIVAPSESDTSYITAIANAVQNIYSYQTKLQYIISSNFTSNAATNIPSFDILEPFPGKYLPIYGINIKMMNFTIGDNGTLNDVISFGHPFSSKNLPNYIFLTQLTIYPTDNYNLWPRVMSDLLKLDNLNFNYPLDNGLTIYAEHYGTSLNSNCNLPFWLTVGEIF